jgi:capsular exopolysaccharide synthesis family protein
MPHDAGLPDPSSHLPPPQHRSPSPIAGRVEPLEPVRPAGPPPAPPPGLSAAPDLGSLLGSLRRRWISAVLLGGSLAAITAIVVWILLTPKAVAFSKIAVAYTPEWVLSAPPGGVGDFKTVLQTTASRIMSRGVIHAALKRDEVQRLNLPALVPDPVTFIEDELKVDFKENSELVTISMSASDPTVATTIANAIQNAYLDDIVYAESAAKARKYQELEKATNEMVDGLKTKRNNLEKLAKTLGATDPAVWLQQRQETLMSLREAKAQQLQMGTRLVEARAALEAFDARAKAERDGTAPGLTAADIEDALDADGEAKQIRARIDRLQTLIADFKSKGSGNDPTPTSARRHVANLKKTLDRRRLAMARKLKRRRRAGVGAGGRGETALVRGQLQKAVDAWTDLDTKLKSEIKDLAAQAARQPQRESEYTALQDETRRDEKVIEDLAAQLKRLDVERRAAPRITRIHDAELMKKDIKKQLLATIAAPVAVLFGVCGVLAMLDHRQRRIRSAGQVSRGLGIRVVGAVPDLPNLERQLVGPSGEPVLEGHPALESIDALRTLLLHEADTRSTRLVMVTSAGAGEGKTTLASHLAGSLARAGRKTLLIDGDLRRPTVHELFELPMQPGFSEVLLGEVEAPEACQETPLDNLAVVTAGQWDREVLAALARDGLEGVFEKLQEEYDFIIIDSHPVLVATDSLLLGRRVDAVILSVRADVSQMPKVYAAAQQLGALGIRVLGAVVNGSDPEEVFTAPAPAAPAGV